MRSGKKRIKLMIFIKCIVLNGVILCREIVNFTRPYVTSQFHLCFIICFNIIGDELLLNFGAKLQR